MDIEIQVALIGLFGSIAGAAIGSGGITYLLKIKFEKVESDRRTFNAYKTILDDEIITNLSSSEFYPGIFKPLVDAVYEINRQSQHPGFLDFFDDQLNVLAKNLCKAVADFSREVPSLTVPSDNLDRITTHTDRSDDQATARRNLEESDYLARYLDQVVVTARAFDETARKRLRI